MNNIDKSEDQEFIDAVNTGYILNRYSPEIAELLVSAKGNSQWLDAVRQGRDISIEEEKAMLPDWLKKERLEPDKGDIDPGTGKEDIEPEM